MLLNVDRQLALDGSRRSGFCYGQGRLGGQSLALEIGQVHHRPSRIVQLALEIDMFRGIHGPSDVLHKGDINSEIV